MNTTTTARNSYTVELAGGLTVTKMTTIAVEV